MTEGGIVVMTDLGVTERWIALPAPAVFHASRGPAEEISEDSLSPKRHSATQINLAHPARVRLVAASRPVCKLAVALDDDEGVARARTSLTMTLSPKW